MIHLESWHPASCAQKFRRAYTEDEFRSYAAQGKRICKNCQRNLHKHGGFSEQRLEPVKTVAP